MANARILGAVAASTAGFAADLAGVAVPGASLAGSLVKGIHESAEQVSIHREKCQALASKCAQILDTIGEHDVPDNIQSDEFKAALDSFTSTLEKIHNQVSKWSQRSFLSLWVQSSRVEEKLNGFSTDLDSALTRLDVGYIFISQKNHEGVKMLLEHHGHHIREMEAAVKDLHNYLRAAEKGDQKAIRHLMNEVVVQARGVAPTEDGANSQEDTRHTEEQKKEYEQRRLLLQELLKHDLPTDVRVLDGQVEMNSNETLSITTHAEVRKGTWLGNDVALKTHTRLMRNDADGRVRARFVSELKVWNEFRNEHIVQLYGIVCDIGPTIQIVSAFQKNGNLEKRLDDYSNQVRQQDNMGIYPPDFDRIKLMRGVAEGLAYLHSCRVVHGKLNCSKILISDDYEAKICDFGMSKLLDELKDNTNTTSITESGGHVRYNVPELLQDTERSPSYATDTWQFASCVLHCFSGETPYHDIKKSMGVMKQIEKGKHPNRPEKKGLSRKWITDDVWALLVHCWSSDPNKRPLMSDNRQAMIKLERSADKSEAVVD